MPNIVIDPIMWIPNVSNVVLQYGSAGYDGNIGWDDIVHTFKHDYILVPDLQVGENRYLYYRDEDAPYTNTTGWILNEGSGCSMTYYARAIRKDTCDLPLSNDNDVNEDDSKSERP